MTYTLRCLDCGHSFSTAGAYDSETDTLELEDESCPQCGSGDNESIERELIDEAALAAWLTEEIRKHRGCEHCTILNVYRLPTLVAGGPNWSVGAFISHNPDQQACECAFGRVKQLALERFDLA